MAGRIFPGGGEHLPGDDLESCLETTALATRVGGTRRADMVAAPSTYEEESEAFYKAGLVVGAGDETYAVRDALKTVGCKWNAVRNKWVAPDAGTLQIAKQLVKNGPSNAQPVAPPEPKSSMQHAPLALENSPSPFDVAATMGQGAGQQPAPLQAAFGGGKKRPQNKIDEQRRKLHEVCTQALLEELIARGVLQPALPTLCEELADRPPSMAELDAAFAELDGAFQ